MSAWWSDTAGYPAGATPAWLPAAPPHSETSLSAVADTGVAIMVLAACLAAPAPSRAFADRPLRSLRWARCP
ncbi:hypothetical protein ABZ656_02020 [Streptomyces sp. NPDC007095]|uniref:hypothetical protein n=1 Tax=Streptomyces sp. NPDC007095 TaxID=3154482 RepID=UPI0026A2A4F5